jgi:predicted RNase H-like nuclease
VTVVGVDGCKTGWVAVVLREDAPPAAHLLSHIDELTALAPDARAIGVDMPIGLPERGRRAADVEARARLGARRQSVFFTPPRAVLDAPNHAAANEAAMRLTGSGISQQCYALAGKIFELDRWVPSAPCDVWEVHPELCFAEMMGAPATASKKTWTGLVTRRAALAAAGIDPDGIAIAAPPDDVLDAAAVAWTARRILAGTARPCPDPPELGVDGRAVAIWT